MGVALSYVVHVLLHIFLYYGLFYQTGQIFYFFAWTDLDVTKHLVNYRSVLLLYPTLSCIFVCGAVVASLLI